MSLLVINSSSAPCARSASAVVSRSLYFDCVCLRPRALAVMWQAFEARASKPSNNVRRSQQLLIVGVRVGFLQKFLVFLERVNLGLVWCLRLVLVLANLRGFLICKANLSVVRRVKDLARHMS